MSHGQSKIIIVITLIATCLVLFLQPLTIDIHSSTFIFNNNNSTDKVESINNYINYPVISPNPVSKSGPIEILANLTDNIGIAKLTVDIRGPSLGTSNQNFTLPRVGSASLSLVSGDLRNGTWMGTFNFPQDLPDGNYIYSLTFKDRLGNTKMSSPFSGIILDRYPPQYQDSQARIISAIDGDNRYVAHNGSTSSKNMTFTFEGRDMTGVVLFMQCNLDDIPVPSEHGEEHGGDITTPRTTYSTCFVADKPASHAVGNHSYVDLGVGNHTFKIRVIDNEYNIGTIPAVFNWTVLPTR